jgi:hypothetical protein
MNVTGTYGLVPDSSSNTYAIFGNYGYDATLHIASMVDEAVDEAVASGRFTTPYPRDAARAVVTMCTALPQWYRPDGEQAHLGVAVYGVHRRLSRNVGGTGQRLRPGDYVTDPVCAGYPPMTSTTCTSSTPASSRASVP